MRLRALVMLLHCLRRLSWLFFLQVNRRFRLLLQRPRMAASLLVGIPADKSSYFPPIRGTSISLVTLADSGGVVASADDSGRITVADLPQLLQAAPGGGPSQGLANIILDEKIGQVVTQLLISPEANRLLVVSWEVTELWEVPQSTLLRRHRLSVNHTSTEEEVKSPFSIRPCAIHHPLNPTSFIVVTKEIGRLFSWADFKELTRPSGIQLLHPTYPHLSTLRTGSYHAIPGAGVLEHRVPSQSSASQLILWPTTAFDEYSDVSGHPLRDDGLEALSPVVHSVLGVIDGTRVIFLDTNLWVRSFDLRLSPTGHVRSRSRSPGPLSGRAGTPAPDQKMISYIRRHFFAMIEWRDGTNNFNCLMVPPMVRSARNGSPNFAFVAGHHVVLVQGGLDFAETVTLGSSGRVSRSEEVGWPGKRSHPQTRSPGSQE